jgi:hypothetical protein
MKKTFSSAALCVGLLCACGAPEQGVGAGGGGEAGVAPTLTIPVGSYPGCTAIAVNFASGDVGVTGPWSGTVTLSTNGDGGATAVLVFQGLATETVAFSPTSSTSAGFKPLDASAGPALAAGSLALVGDMLLISAYGGDGNGTGISSFYSCPLPSSLSRATLAIRTPTTGAIPTGTYGACTMSFQGSEWSPSGGGFSLTIAESDASLTVMSGDGFAFAVPCDLAFHDISGSTATLSDGQTCTVPEPCGPGPSMGPSSAPSDATLTNMTGSIEVVGGVLFINVIGDAPSAACGNHTLSVICPVVP